MRVLRMDDIITPELAEGAILNEAFPGFMEDYLVLHCLMRKASPKRILEIGTNTGVGTRILANAVPGATVMTLDLPKDESYKSKQHPQHLGVQVGRHCDRPYTQLFGDSLIYDYSQLYPLDAWFIDGEHDEAHVLHESRQAIQSCPKLIVWHDADIPEVMSGITKALDAERRLLELVVVLRTRIAFTMRDYESILLSNR